MLFHPPVEVRSAHQPHANICSRTYISISLIVYHWASVIPGPSWGRVLGFFAGALNFYSWLFDLSSIAFIPANVLVQMYAIYHPDLAIEAWHVFIAFVLVNILCCATVIFGNRFQPALQSLGLFMVVVGGLVTVIVLAAIPRQHASSSFVWKDWDNETGWSGGAAFLTGEYSCRPSLCCRCLLR